jgi:hypothetical protein
MVPSALLITKPSVDFGTFLGLSQQALGYNPSQRIDASPVERSDAERFLSCLASLTDEHAQAGLPPHLLTHVSFSVLVAADDRDMLDILQLAAGMSFVIADTLMRGVQLAVITGTLAQWQLSVKSGSDKYVELNVRAFFNRVMSAFQTAGLDVWKDCDCRVMSDHTYYLEDKRR